MKNIPWLKIKNAPFITLGLILINALMFLLTEITGSSESSRHMFRWGAMLTSALSENQEYWRLLTSMFLHFGIMHLAHNMLVLFAIGSILEKGAGHVRFLLIYLLSGLGANIFSYWIDWKKGEEVLSAGASGAVFGLMGAMVFAGLFAKEWVGALTLPQVALMLVLSLYHGANEAVDDAAHLSGLLMGFVLAVILLKIFPGEKGRRLPREEADSFIRRY